jgi:hypothetical protein
MLEVTLFLVVITVITLVGMRSEIVRDELVLSIDEDLTLHNKFLVELQHDVEARLTARPSDATLTRHYNALVKAEIDTRLSLMPSA